MGSAVSAGDVFGFSALYLISVVVVGALIAEISDRPGVSFPRAALIWPIALIWWAVQRGIVRPLAAHTGEAGRLRRELRRIHRQRALLAARQHVERERVAYEREVDEYLKQVDP